jgi:predicted ATPase/DNA-binding winged helix-turn-helix (wHTH) protein
VSFGDHNQSYAFGKWEVDFGRRELRANGTPVTIGGRAFDIVEVLVRSAGEVVSKADLASSVWPGVTVVENAVEVHISAIRKAFGADRSLLKTVAGRGYWLAGTWRPTSPGPSKATGHAARPSHFRFGSSPFPLSGSELVGRSAVVGQLRALMSEYRVVTLTGPGGIGKTRLARAVAHGVLSQFEDQGCYVELAALSDARLVPSVVARALGLELGAHEISAAAVTRAIGSRKVLLLLDNCEHVIDAAAELAEAVVRSCAHASLLVTSRELLRIDGEYVYRVPPLDVPPPGERDWPLLLDYGAVRLFAERTGAMRSDFKPDMASALAMASICRRLDGIPLAIEFAAARAATLGMEQVLARLKDRFALLSSGHRTALPRHQTLRATLDWSYGLLTDSEQRLFRFLAVFAGGFTIEAAVAVTKHAASSTALVAEDVANLVSKSLVILDGSGTKSRWVLLETVREYALEKLTEKQESRFAARLHAEYFRDLVATAGGAPPRSIVGEGLAGYAREIDNVRAALDWAFSPSGDPSVGLVLTAAYVPVWLHLSLVFECRGRAERALDHVGPDSNLDRSQMMQLNLAFGVALTHTTPWSVSETDTALTRALALAETSDDVTSQLRALWALWTSHFTGGNFQRALGVAERYLRLAHRQGDLADILVGDRLKGSTLHYTGRQPEARRHLQRVLDLYVAPSDQRHTAWFMFDQRVLARATLARVAWLQGFLDEAAASAKASVEEAQAAGNDLSLCYALAEAACPIAIATGDYDAGEQWVTRLVEVATRHGFDFWARMGHCLQGKLLVKRGRFVEGAARLRTTLDGFRLADYLNFFGDLAEGLAASGSLAEGLAALDDALERSGRNETRWCLAEALRIKGNLHLRESSSRSTVVAEACFTGALEVAERQGALFWGVRTALSLARLRVHQGREEEAARILAPVYGRFTEGLETPDLRAARSLLEALPPRGTS